jgi:ribosome recycling factor
LVKAAETDVQKLIDGFSKQIDKIGKAKDEELAKV